MTINDLKKVCSCKATVTELAFYSNGEYYSFRTAYGEPVNLEEIDGDISSLEICTISPAMYFIRIEVKRILDN